MTLTHDNYYGHEANKTYMSKSQFSRWRHCQSATLAELNGLYAPEKSTAFLVGGYIDAALDSPDELERFKAEHPEMFKRDGGLKADFVQAEQIVARCLSDRLFCLLTGNAPETRDHVQRQAILVGEISGVKFRGKADYLLDETACNIIMREFSETSEVLGGPFTEGALVDLKSTKDFGSVWVESERAKLSWAMAYGYDYQGAIYRELYRQMTGKVLPFLLVAATKEKATDIGAFYIPPAELDAALSVVESEAPHYEQVKRGEVEPTRCGHCEWCKATKQLTSIKNITEDEA